MALLTGTAPVSTMRNYQRDVISYTKGRGRLTLSLSGYEPCHNAEEVIAPPAMISIPTFRILPDPSSAPTGQASWCRGMR